jgi:hypothetical protein
MKRICSRCKKELGPEVDAGEEGVTHGICRECVDRVMAGSGEMFDEFLDSLDAPVFVVDKDRSVLTANALGRDLVSKDMGLIRGRLAGEVFGCPHAHLPEGCGQTVHCQSCTIRNSVMKTFTTGMPCIRVPACLDLDTITGPRQMRFLISTEKVGNVAVFLRIDNVRPETLADG